MDKTVLVICLCALATYGTRISGHLLLSRFGRLNHRVEAALNAVPVAVLTALIAPSLATEGPAEAIGLGITGLLSIRFSMIVSVSAGLAGIVFLRTVSLGF